MDIEQKEKTVADLKQLMSKAGYDESASEQFCTTVSDILQLIIDNPDEERSLKYKTVRHLDRIEFIIDASGNKIDPLADGKGAPERRLQNAVNSVLFNPETTVSVTYTPGWNHLIVKSPSKIGRSRILNDPMVKSMMAGAAAGVFCRAMPEGFRAAFLDELAVPVMTAVIELLKGIMGPVFFLFIIVSLASLGTIEEISKIGKIIFKRFVVIAVRTTLLTTAVALLFFPVLGGSDTSIDLSVIERILLIFCPADIITPFAECRIPQIIVLALVLSTALFMMGDHSKALTDALARIKDWGMELVFLLVKLIPLIPFISTMRIIATGHADVFINGWKYIAATYICYFLSIVIELIMVTAKCRVSISFIWSIIKQIIAMEFAAATVPATMGKLRGEMERQMGIEDSFSDLWHALSKNLLKPSTTISLVLASFFISDITGSSLDVTSLLTMIVSVILLSMASMGTITGTTIILETFNISTHMVGIFSTLEIFTGNAGAVFDTMYRMLEQLNTAYAAGMGYGYRTERKDN